MHSDEDVSRNSERVGTFPLKLFKVTYRFGRNSWSGTNVTCSTKVDDGAHQLWHVERVSRTSQEIKDLLEKWKPDTTKQLFQPYGDDAE